MRNLNPGTPAVRQQGGRLEDQPCACAGYAYCLEESLHLPIMEADPTESVMCRAARHIRKLRSVKDVLDEIMTHLRHEHGD